MKSMIDNLINPEKHTIDVYNYQRGIMETIFSFLRYDY
jgi:hypothetical protein